MVTFATNFDAAISHFELLMEREYEGADGTLCEEVLAEFRRYSSWAFRNRRKRPFYGHVYAQRLQYIVSVILDNPGIRILDAGCGLGSESILFGLLGAEVIGVDLNKPKLTVARKRIPHYNKVAGFEIRVQFSNTDVFKVLDNDVFDIIWSSEAISHIHPAKDFIKLSYRHLNKGGALIISETNFLTPYVVMKKIWQTRSLRTTIAKNKDPLTGEIIPVANERLFTTYQMKNMLKEAGFNIERIEITHFIPVFLIPSVNYFHMVREIEHLMEKAPLLKYLGTDYRVVGIKPP